MSKLTRFLGQGTCLPDAPFCSPAVLRREAELIRDNADAAGAEAWSTCDRPGGCADLAAIKRAEVRTRLSGAVHAGDTTKLAALLKEAADAHHRFEERLGSPDPDWPTWYAQYLLGKEV